MTYVRESSKELNDAIESYGLDSLKPPIDLRALALSWGVDSVEYGDISSDAMLLPSTKGYCIVLSRAASPGEVARQRFSFAHELGHLALRQLGYDEAPKSAHSHRSRYTRDPIERACDEIAAEILMPRSAFITDASRSGWSLHSLRGLARLYETSFEATARRMTDLMPEPCLMGIWKPAPTEADPHILERSWSPAPSYAIRNSNHVPRRRSWLIARAEKSTGVESGIAPIVNKKRLAAQPVDVPSEAVAWGSNENRKVMVFYYPERDLSKQMVALSNATGRLS